MKYESVAEAAYSILNKDEEYNNLGQVALNEVAMTVLPNAYTQIGILLPDGVRELFDIDVLPETQEDEGKPSEKIVRNGDRVLPRPLNDNDVFIDIGSGVGNINLQVFCETAVKKSIGIELLPSRNAYADLAKTICALFFSDLFSDGKRELEFITADFVDKENETVKNAFNEATVIFSHSWMFPEELMVKFGERILNDGPKIDLVISSRAVPQLNGDVSNSTWIMSKAELQADWNEKSPFFIYHRKI